MTFDFIFTGRTNNPNIDTYENFFRVGFDGASGGNGCDGQTSHFPSMWLTPPSTGDYLFIIISSEAECSSAQTLTGFGTLTADSSYHMLISFDHGSALVEITDTTAQSLPWSLSWSRSELDPAHIDQFVPVWWMTSRLGDVQYNVGGGAFDNVTITSFAETTTTTAVPTSSPSADPTGSPSADPTSSPSADPTSSPSADPTSSPSAVPTSSPSAVPTGTPSAVPTSSPSADPTGSPS